MSQHSDHPPTEDTSTRPVQANAAPADTKADPEPDAKIDWPNVAIRHGPAVVAFGLITVFGLVADLWSKHAVFEALLNDPAVEAEVRQRDLPDKITTAETFKHLRVQQDVLWGGKVRFHLSTNPGVVFGWSMPPIVVSVVSILTIGLVFLFFAVGDRRAWSMHIGLACIMAGALGNLYDRLFGAVHVPGFEAPITNQVRDFIDLSGIQVWGFSYDYIFNIADVLLVIGVLLLIVN